MSAPQDTDVQSLRELFTFQELSFVDPFGQDLDHDSADLQEWLSYGDNIVGYETCSAPEGEKSSKLAKKGKSNPFYSPPRQTINLVQKEKNLGAIKRQIEENIENELQDAGLSCNDAPTKRAS